VSCGIAASTLEKQTAAVIAEQIFFLFIVRSSPKKIKLNG